MDDSIKLANWWVQLNTLKETLDNEIIPVGSYLGIQDSALMGTLEELSVEIQSHYKKFKLVAVVRQTNY